MKYRIVLHFDNHTDVSSIILEEKPSKKEIKEVQDFYHATSHTLEEIEDE
jgi:hypothetical protein